MAREPARPRVAPTSTPSRVCRVRRLCGRLFRVRAAPDAHRAHAVQPLRAARRRLAPRSPRSRPSAARLHPEQRLRRIPRALFRELPAVSRGAPASVGEARGQPGESARRSDLALARGSRTGASLSGVGEAAKSRREPAFGARAPRAHRHLRVRHRLFLHGRAGHRLVRGPRGGGGARTPNGRSSPERRSRSCS